MQAAAVGMNWIKEEMAQKTNLQKRTGSLAEAAGRRGCLYRCLRAGAGRPGDGRDDEPGPPLFSPAPIPTPEIFPDEAKAGGAKVVSTGRSDYPNQINNVLAFPGVFRGTFDVRASDINEEMKMAAAGALAALITPEELSADYTIPGRSILGSASGRGQGRGRSRRTGVARCL